MTVTDTETRTETETLTATHTTVIPRTVTKLEETTITKLSPCTEIVKTEKDYNDSIVASFKPQEEVTPEVKNTVPSPTKNVLTTSDSSKGGPQEDDGSIYKFGDTLPYKYDDEEKQGGTYPDHYIPSFESVKRKTISHNIRKYF